MSSRCLKIGNIHVFTSIRVNVYIVNRLSMLWEGVMPSGDIAGPGNHLLGSPAGSSLELSPWVAADHESVPTICRSIQPERTHIGRQLGGRK